MLERWIKTDEGWIALKPVPLELLPALEDMLALVRASQFGKEDRLAIAAKILSLHERLDSPGVYGVALDSILSHVELDVFFGVGGYFDLLNQLTPPPSDGDVDEFPPWSSGCYLDDWLADLIYSLGDYRQAQAFVSRHSLQTTMNVLHRLRDLQKGSKGREEDANKKWYWQNITSFMDFGDDDDDT